MLRMISTLLMTQGLALALATAVTAQDYPTKPVRIIVPFPPAGSNDLVARAVATPLGERLGKQVIVDKTPGAGAVSRHQAGGKRAQGRPHAAHHLAHARDQSLALQAALRSEQELRSDRDDRFRADRAHGQYGARGQIGQ